MPRRYPLRTTRSPTYNEDAHSKIDGILRYADRDKRMTYTTRTTGGLPQTGYHQLFTTGTAIASQFITRSLKPNLGPPVCPASRCWQSLEGEDRLGNDIPLPDAWRRNGKQIELVDSRTNQVYPLNGPSLKHKGKKAIDRLDCARQRQNPGESYLYYKFVDSTHKLKKNPSRHSMFESPELRQAFGEERPRALVKFFSLGMVCYA